MKRLSLYCAVLLGSLFASTALAEKPRVGVPEGEIKRPNEEQAHSFCLHAAPHFKLNFFDFFSYKEHNEHEIHKCVETVLEHGQVVIPGQLNADGNPVTKPEVNIDQALHDPAIYRPTVVGPPYIAAIINFLILLFVLLRFAKKPLQTFLDARYNTIRKELDDATQRFQEAQARLAEYEQRLKSMEDSRKSLMAQYEEQAKKEVDALKKDSVRQIEKIQADAQREIQNALRNAENNIRREAVEAAITMAENILTKELSPSDRKNLAEQFIERVATTKPQRLGGDA